MSGVTGRVAALQDPDRDVRIDAAWAIGEIGPGAREAVQALVTASQDSDVHMRLTAACALRRINTKEG